MNFFTQLWQWLRPVAESAAEDAIERKLTNQPITAGNIVQDVIQEETAAVSQAPAPQQSASAPAAPQTNQPAQNQ